MNRPEYLKLPKGFKPWKGRASFDMPQELFKFGDYDSVKIVRRNGEQSVLPIYKIDWTASFKKTDIVGYKRPEGNQDD